MRTKTRKKSRVILPQLVILLLLISGGWYWLNSQINQPHTHPAAARIVTITPGTSQQQILRQLENEGIIQSNLPLRLWLRTFGRNLRLKAGDYRFPSPISAREAVELLARGQIATRTVTIPEGYNRYDIVRVLADIPGLREPAPTTPESLLPLFDRPELIADLDPEARNLEGYLFPDTYEYTTLTKREEIVEMMVGRFRQVFNEALRGKARERGMTVRQAVSLASLIEKEARVDTEREMISAVFHRRMRENVPLACDPTVIYAALLANKYRGKIYRSDLDRESPYNTYRQAGLPPGPIASPGKRSLEASLNPAPVDYLYFVVDVTKNDGSHLFSTRSADHEAAVRRLRQFEHESKR
ncbi:MAG: endolytic transglycosylase MltG [Acidobacteriota bacterium]